MHDIISQQQKFVAAFRCVAEAAKERTLAIKDIHPYHLLEQMVEELFVFRIGFPRQSGKTTYIKDFVEQYPESFVLLSGPDTTFGEVSECVKENLGKKTFIIDGVSTEISTGILYLIKIFTKQENRPGGVLSCSSVIIIY